MKNYIIAIGLSLLFVSFASAHGITINTDKVIFNHGISKREMVNKMQCMIHLKEIKDGETTKEEIFAKKMKKIHEKCETHKMNKEKCHAMKKLAAKKLHACFVGAKFMKKFFGMEDGKTPETGAAATPAAETTAQ